MHIKITNSSEEEKPSISVEILESDKVLEFLNDKIEESLKVKTEPKKLSDDIVVLPDPVEVKIIPSIEKTTILIKI